MEAREKSSVFWIKTFVSVGLPSCDLFYYYSRDFALVSHCYSRFPLICTFSFSGASGEKSDSSNILEFYRRTLYYASMQIIYIYMIGL